jgi:hypothetical protein
VAEEWAAALTVAEIGEIIAGSVAVALALEPEASVVGKASVAKVRQRINV